MPLLALVVALLLVASQSLYTVDQRKYAIKFQLGEIIETQPQRRPVLQGSAGAERQVLRQAQPDCSTIPSPTASRRRRRSRCWSTSSCCGGSSTSSSTTSRAGRRGSRARAGCRRRCARTSPRNSTSARCTRRSPRERDKIMTTTRQKADADAKTIGVEVVDVRLRRVELPPDVTGPVYARMESERRRVANELRSLGAAESEKIRADADRQRAGDPRRRVHGRRRRSRATATRKASAIYAPAYGAESRSSMRSTAASRRTRRRSAARAT